MAVFTVSLFQGGVGSVNVGDGTLLANLSVSAGRGPKGDGFTGGSFNASTGVVTFTSNDGLGFATGDLRGDLSDVDITGGTIDGTVIGGSTPAAISGTTGSFSGDVSIADKIVHTGDTNTAIRFPAADTVTVETGGSERVRVTNSRLEVSRFGSPFSLPGNLSVQTAILMTPGTGTAGSGSDLSIMGGNTSNVAVHFGDTDSGTIGRITYVHNGNSMAFAVNNGERMRITSTGNVGIGLTNPSASLHISRNTAFGVRLERTGASPSTAEMLNEGDSLSLSSTAGAGVQIRTGSTPTERLRVAQNGNVGINANTPKARLHIDRIAGSFSVPANIDGNTSILTTPGTTNTGSGNAVGIMAGNAATSAINFGDTENDRAGRVVYAHSNNTMAFHTDGGERLSITSTGNVGIGLTNPSASLHISRNTFLGVRLERTGGSPSTAEMLNAGDSLTLSSTAGAGVQIHTGSTPTERLRVAQNGNVGIGTSSPSERLSVIGNVTISGSLSKGSGSFKIDHPVKPDTHHLVHSFIEGPQADNLYRGKVSLIDGIATVNLDEAGRMTEGTFVALNGNVQCFTANEAGWTQVRGKVEGNILTIEAQDTACTDEVSWLVIGERHDQHMIDTNWTDAQGRIITEPEKVIDIELESDND